MTLTLTTTATTDRVREDDLQAHIEDTRPSGYAATVAKFNAPRRESIACLVAPSSEEDSSTDIAGAERHSANHAASLLFSHGLCNAVGFTRFRGGWEEGK